MTDMTPEPDVDVDLSEHEDDAPVLQNPYGDKDSEPQDVDDEPEATP